MKRSRISIILILGLFFLNDLSIGKAKTQDSPLITYTFSELGFTTSTTYNSGSFSLTVSCTGSSLGVYAAKIFLHFTGEDSYYFYRINGGAEGYMGGPGNSFLSGWEERYIHPGFFQEGNNSLQIVIHNYPLIEYDPVSSKAKYLTAIHDSYIEIYDATALPLAIEWQGYEFNETNLIFTIVVIEKLTNFPVNTTNVIIQGSGENVSGSFIGNGVFQINLPLPEQNVNLTLVIEGEGYETTIVNLDLTARVDPDIIRSKPTLDIVSIIVGVFIGVIVAILGVYYLSRRSMIFFSQEAKKKERIPFFCIIDNGQHPATESAYECSSCRRIICEKCYEDSKSTGFTICPFCKGELVKIQ